MASRGADYDERFAQLARAGQYLHGEADLVDRLLGGPPALVLDAGCGTGRVAVELAARGYRTHGVDVDAQMLDQARAKAPDLSWQLADLSATDLGDLAADLAVAAGNVMVFVPDAGRPAAVVQLYRALRPGGLLVAGFTLGRTHQLGAALTPSSGTGALTLDDYERLCRLAGFTLLARLATWDGTPFAGGDYVVCVHRRPGPAAMCLPATGRGTMLPEGTPDGADRPRPAG